MGCFVLFFHDLNLLHRKDGYVYVLTVVSQVVEFRPALIFFFKNVAVVRTLYVEDCAFSYLCKSLDIQVFSS